MREAVRRGEVAAVVAYALDRLSRKQANLARSLALLDDGAAVAPVLAEMRALPERKRQLVEERDALAAQREAWREAQERLADLAHWCRTLDANLPTLTYEQRRDLLRGFGIRVELFHSGHDPRFVIKAAISLDTGEVVALPRIVYSAPRRASASSAAR